MSNINYKYGRKSNQLFCGLFGYSGKKPCDIDKIRILMYVNSIERGEDATGLYSPLNGLKKSLFEGWKIAANRSETMLPDKTLMGHVRSKTIGANILENTHPFERGNYFLAHNGTLRNHVALLKKYGLNNIDFNVDSDIIVGCIEKNDNFDVISELNGAAALLIHDDRHPNRLYVFKKGGATDNDKRTLYKGTINGGMYISSISESLCLIGCKNIKEFKDDVLYTIEEGLIRREIAIKNEPYTEPYSIGNYADNSESNVLYKAIGGWLRSKYTCSLRYHDSSNISLVKDKYYFVTSLISNSTIEILDDVSHEKVKVSIHNMVIDDIISNNDYVMVLFDVYSKITATNILAPKDSIFICSTSYNDGDVSIQYPTSKQFLAMSKRINFRKLTPEELVEYKASLTPNLPIVIPFKPYSMNEVIDEEFMNEYEGAANPIITENDTDLSKELEAQFNQEDDDDGYYDLQVNSQALEQVFNELDDFAEELNEIHNKADKDMQLEYKLGCKIIDLMDYIYKQRNIYFQPETILK